MQIVVTDSSYYRARSVAIAKDFVSYAILVVASILSVGPLIFVIGASLHQTQTRVVDFAVFQNPDFINYREIIQNHPFGRWMLNSLIVAGSVTVLTLIIDSMAGYAFAKKRFPARNLLFYIMLATLMVPLPVTLLPTFLLASQLKIINTFPALIMPGLANTVGVFLMRQFIQTIPSELEDAARIDGMSEFGIYLRIIIPLSIPGLAALAIFTFLMQWGSLLWPLVVASTNDTRTIPPGLATIPGQYGTNWGLVAAMTIMSMLPMLIVFLVLQRYLSHGAIAGRTTKG